MRFIHTGDIHLGMKPNKGSAWSEARGQELWNSFSELISICAKEQIELLLIAGDLFHSQPLIRELKEVSSLFTTIPNTHIVMIAGNHDYISGVSKYNSFEWPSNVVFLSEESISDIYFEDINTRVYGLSFHHREIHSELLSGIKPGNNSEINILLAHGGEPNNLPVNREELGNSAFDYLAFGHIHKPQCISDRYRYCGSLEPLDKNETGEHGYISGEITKEDLQTSVLHADFVAHAVRQYLKVNFSVSPETTWLSLKSSISQYIQAHGISNIYCLTLSGQRDADIDFMSYQTELMNLGNILELVDNTIPNFDYETLKSDNRGNLIGMYIDAVQTMDGEDSIKDRALYYGVAALLNKLQ